MAKKKLNKSAVKSKPKKAKIKSRKKPLIQKAKIRKYLNKYFKSRLKQYNITYRSEEFKKLSDDIYNQLKKTQKSDKLNISEYKSTVKNVILLAKGFYPRKYKGDEVVPFAPEITDSYFSPFHYFELIEFFETSLVNTKNLFFYSDTLYRGSIEGGKKEVDYQNFFELIKELIRFLNDVQDEISNENGDYDYEIKCIVRWRRSDGKGNYIHTNRPYWHRDKKMWQLEVMFCDEQGNKIGIVDWKVPKIDTDGDLLEPFEYDENDSEKIANDYIDGNFGEGKVKEAETVEKSKEKEPKLPPPKEVEKDKEIQILKIKEETKRLEIKIKEETKRVEIKSKEDLEVRKQKLADFKDLLKSKTITLKEYMEMIKQV